MSRRIVQITLIVGVMLGLLLPKTSAALSELGLIGSRTVVICTGAGLKEITLTDNGQPAPQSEAHHEAPCLLVHALDCWVQPETPVWIALAGALQPARQGHLWHETRIAATHFARAPPRV